jgi:hypothetical protein
MSFDSLRTSQPTTNQGDSPMDTITMPEEIIKGGIGHNLPQEAPQAFAQAVVDVDGY